MRREKAAWAFDADFARLMSRMVILSMCSTTRKRQRRGLPSGQDYERGELTRLPLEIGG